MGSDASADGHAVSADVAVIGAGAAGLAASRRLVEAGLSVLLAFAAVYVHADGARIVLAFASGIGVGAIMCLAASSRALAQRPMS